VGWDGLVELVDVKVSVGCRQMGPGVLVMNCAGWEVGFWVGATVVDTKSVAGAPVGRSRLFGVGVEVMSELR
jgi:hypothetical protein